MLDNPKPTRLGNPTYISLTCISNESNLDGRSDAHPDAVFQGAASVSELSVDHRRKRVPMAWALRLSQGAHEAAYVTRNHSRYVFALRCFMPGPAARALRGRYKPEHEARPTNTLWAQRSYLAFAAPLCCCRQPSSASPIAIVRA